MRKEAASQRVYDFISNGIKNGIWKAGEKIPSENILSRDLDVSRVSVRRALDQLVGVGLIQKRRGAGSYVSQINTIDALDTLIPIMQMNDIDMIDLLEYRIGFESTNIELLQYNINDKMIQQLEYCLEMMKKYEYDLDQFYIYDYQFHNLIAEGTKNSIVIKISQLLTKIMKHHLKYLNTKIGPGIGLEYHEKIISAIKENDFVIAARYMKKHIEVTIDAVKKVLNENNIELKS